MGIAMTSTSFAATTIIGVRQDTHIHNTSVSTSGSVGSAGGQLTELWMSTANNYIEQPWMQFDLGGVDLSQIESVTLLMTLTSNTNLSNAKVALTGTLGTWDAGSLTAENAPSLTSIADSTLASLGGTTPQTLITWSGDALANFVKGSSNGLVTLAVTRRFGNTALRTSFASSENTGTDGPRLQIVTTTPIPEPSATALFGIGGLALMFRRRR